MDAPTTPEKVKARPHLKNCCMTERQSPSVAYLAAYTCQSVITLRLLPVKTVKGSVYTKLFHSQKQISDGRIWSLPDYILFGRESLSVLRNGIPIVPDKRLRIVGFPLHVPGLYNHCWNTVLIESDYISMSVNMRKCIGLIMRVVLFM